jgi:hypothetical protein
MSEAMSPVNVGTRIHHAYQMRTVNVVNVGECSAPFSRTQEEGDHKKNLYGAQHSPTFTGAGPSYLVGPVNVGADIHRQEAMGR